MKGGREREADVKKRRGEGNRSRERCKALFTHSLWTDGRHPIFNMTLDVAQNIRAFFEGTSSFYHIIKIDSQKPQSLFPSKRMKMLLLAGY